MRRLQDALSQGALPPAFGSPRDISCKDESLGKVAAFHLCTNIPAGGSAAAHPRHAAGPGAQNSSFKNFPPSEARR